MMYNVGNSAISTTSPIKANTRERSITMTMLSWPFAWSQYIFAKVLFNPSLPASWQDDPAFQGSIFRHPRVIEVLLRMSPEERRAFETDIRALYAFLEKLIAFMYRYFELEEHHVKQIRKGIEGPVRLQLENSPKSNGQSWIGEVSETVMGLMRKRSLYLFIVPIVPVLYLKFSP